jgi:hypothetical protein
VVDKIVEGWVGKPKGSFQILWERGLINPSKERGYYTVKGKKDALGKIVEGSSFRTLIKAQPDFAEEETLLQYHVSQSSSWSIGDPLTKMPS